MSKTHSLVNWKLTVLKKIDEKLRAQQYVITRNAIAIYFFLYFCFYLQSYKSVNITNTVSYLPGFLHDFTFFATETFLISICVFGLVLSIVLFLGIMDRITALLFYFLLLILNFVNLFIYQLHIAFFSIMLLTFVIFSNQKFFQLNKLFSKSDYVSKDWQLFLYGMMCLILTISGLSKVFVFEWRDGSIMAYLCKISVVSYFFEDFFCSLPKAFFAFITYAALLLEIASLPLFLFKKTRRFTLYLELALFAGITFEVGHVYNMTALMMIYTFFCFPFNRKTES